MLRFKRDTTCIGVGLSILQLLYCISFIQVVCGECNLSNDFDPCSEQNHIRINDPTRSTSYRYTGAETSDYSLAENWYRFTSPAGGDMPTTPQSRFSCGAVVNIYLDGEIPTETGVTQTIRACASFSPISCIRQYDISIRHCGMFNVYCLKPTSQTYDRYCFGSESPCPEGLSSPTGFTPFCSEQHSSDLNLQNAPTISVATVYDPDPDIEEFCTPSYMFWCDIEHGDTSVFYDVEWFVDGEPIQSHKEEHAVAATNMPNGLPSAKLEEAGYQLGINLTCRITARSINQTAVPVGNTRETDFFVGVQVDDASQFIAIREGGSPAYYTARFTIPYRCAFTQWCSDEEQEENCKVAIDIVTPEHNDATCTANNDVVIELDRNQAGCTTMATTTGFSLKIHANPDHVYNPQRQMVLQLETRPNDELPLWSKYQLPRAHVVINDTEKQRVSGRVCRVYNDPHFMSFDGTRFEVQLEGAFIMYKHKTLPILLEAYFVDRGRYTHQCGGAIRSGSEVFVFDACRQSSPLFISAYECGEGLKNMKIRRINSRRYEITLPTGTVISMGDYWMTVTPSVFDYGRTEGLCGNVNGNPSDADDRVIRGTNRVDVRRSRAFNEFSNSWRVEDDESLYYGAVRDSFDYNDIVFCACSNNTDPGASCSTAPNVKHCVAGSHNEASGDRHRCTLSRRRKRRDVEGSDLEEEPRQFFPFNPAFVAQPAGWTGEWTHERATQHCEEYFASQQRLAACNNIPNTDRVTAIAECIEDIRITGNTDNSQIHTDVFRHTCLVEAEGWNFESETPEEIPEVQPTLVAQVLHQVCQSDCSEHGTCQDGNCVCDAGYTDADCSSEINHVPQLFPLPSNGTCARNVKPCEVAIVYGDRFVENSVSCKLQLKDINQEPLSDIITEEGEYVHLQKMLCPIAVEDFGLDMADIIGPYFVDISVSNNGVDYSEIKQLIVYSALCWSCSHERGCENLDNRCFVGDVCYNDGETIPDRACRYCDGASGSWLTQHGKCYIDGACYANSTLNPLDENLMCKSGASQAGWTPVNVDECLTANCGNGRCVDDINSHTCTCNPGWTGQHCQENIDECAGVICGNGVCEDGIDTYRCRCNPGWEGANCNANINDCAGVNCGNGVCEDGIDAYRCRCNSGWEGAICNVNVDECAGVNCGNGVCEDGIDTYRCRCNPGWEGANCNANINDCAGVNCGNGVCEDGIDAYRCRCNPGWEGAICNVNVDECAGVNCGNGVCEDGIDAYRCRCNPGWEGANCNEQVVRSTTERAAGGCGDNGCGQHGTCVNNACRCQEPYEGQLCDQLKRYDCPNNNPCASGSLSYYPHIEDTKFIQCVHGSCYNMPCAPGTVWDQNIQNCNWP